MKKNIIIKYLLLFAGVISLILGVIGVFLPVLPTTPFLLLAALCFSKSSDKFYHWLINNKIFGEYIRDYREKKGITLTNKIIALSVLYVGIGYSIYKMQHKIYVVGFLLIVAIAVTVHILKLKILKKEEKWCLISDTNHTTM